MSTLVLNTDASESGGALMVTRATTAELDHLLISQRYNGGALHSEFTVVRCFVQSRPWRVALSYRWMYSDHINNLEAASIAIGMRWYATHRPGHVRVVLLTDSAVTMGVLAKGRSSRPSLMRYARHIAAILLAFDIDLLTVHVPTDLNPSDGPSRQVTRMGHVVRPARASISTATGTGL